MEYDKINNLLLSEDSESEHLSNFFLENMLELIVYLILIVKINQLDLKPLCYDQIYAIIQMRIY